MALTKEEIQKHIEDQTALIAKLQQDAQLAFKRLEADANNQIGRAQGKIEVYEAELKALDGETPAA